MPESVEGQVDRETAAPSQPHIELVQSENPSDRGAESHPSPGLRDSKGWDGKLRVDRNALLQNPEAISDPEYSDDENVLRGDEISADEGMAMCMHALTSDLKCLPNVPNAQRA